MTKKKIVILGTGGTIAGTAARSSDNVGYTAAQVGINELVGALPTLAEGPCELLVEQVAQLDSKDMSFAVWAKLAGRVAHFLALPDVRGIVITHGTDTLEETAWFLHALLNPAKPVVLTCAMRPATALVPDGPQNMLDAAAVAAFPEASGVLVVCAGVIHGALDVQKIHTYRLDAFGSGDAGPIGYVEEGRLRLTRNWPDGPVVSVPAAMQFIANDTVLRWPQVEIVMNYAGASGATVQALVAAGVRGLVAAGTGNGTLHHELEGALLNAQAAGVRVVRATRCAEGRVLPGASDAIPDSRGLTPVKARVQLMLELMG